MTRRYVYRYNEINGQPAWQWRLKNTQAWLTCATENEAMGRMMADAVKHGAEADIEDVSVVRPRAPRANARPQQPTSSAEKSHNIKAEAEEGKE